MSDIERFLAMLECQFPNDSWFVYASLVFQANDRMDYIGRTWDYVLKHTPSQGEQVIKARKLREALLKSSVLVGFPKGVNACMALRSAVQERSPEVGKLLDMDSSPRQHLPRSNKDARGLAFFTKMYAQHALGVLHNMALASGGDLSDFAISAMYGELMAEESRLDAKETGLLEFLACYATGGSAWLQAKEHMYGSRNLGNGKEQINGAIAICKIIERELAISVYREPAENWAWVDQAGNW